MDCDYEGCVNLSCASTSEWLSPDGLLVKYWCQDHVPKKDPELEWYCWARVMTVGCCPTCELAKGDKR